MLREMIFEGLKESGYNLVSIEETDAILRENGFSDGGQLARVDKKEICKWLKVDAIVSVNVTDFNEVMVGIYNKKIVGGEVAFWLLSDKKNVLSLSEEVLKINMPKSFLGGLVGQVAKSWWGKIKNKPLAYESTVFSRQVVGKFPGLLR